MTDLINGSASVSSVIDRDSAAGLRSVVKQRITVSVNSWQSWGQPCVSVLAEAPKGTRVVVWFGSGTELAPGCHGSAKALPRAASLSVLAVAPSSWNTRSVRSLIYYFM